MKINFNYKPWLTALCLAGAMLIPSAYAGVANNGLFELDANPQDDSSVLGDDWATPPTEGVNNALYFSTIIEDPYPNTIFDGGKKDIQDISSWSWKDGAVPDKDNLTNAYAAAYKYDHDTNPATPSQLVLYFGADRFSNVGDAFMGFWFFQQKVKEDPLTGLFSGSHTNGDTLVLVDYPQGTNEIPYIAVVVWDTTCTKAASNDPIPDECAATNLRLKAESSGTVPALCDSTLNQDACAITNPGNVDSPWTYMPKSGTANVFPYESFFEGGINLTKLVGNKCFSSFMAETRSSSSFTASLKDFVLHDFENCSIKIVKKCENSQLTTDNLAIENTFSGYVVNTGFGTLYDVKVKDNNGTKLDDTDDFYVSLVKDEVAQGETVAFSAPVILTSPDNPMTNIVTVTAAATSGGEATVNAKTEATCEPLELSPVISVNKTCSTAVVSDEGTPAKLNIKVEYTGKVCNKSAIDGPAGPINLKLVTVTDDYLGTPTNLTDDDIPLITGTNTELKGQTLAAGTCINFTGSYYPPVAGSSLPKDISFSDTVTASGTAVLGGGTATNTYTADCKLCPTCPTTDCPQTTPTFE